MRLIARFAQEKEAFFEVITVYDERTVKERLNKKTPALISIAGEYPAATWFERKITDDFGIEILYSNDKRPLVYHKHFSDTCYPMRKAFTTKTLEYKKVEELEDKDTQRVSIGPTHPFHLESCQFQVFDKENTILNFEAKTFYKYRGIEKMLEGLSLEEAAPIIERISASQTIAYQIAFLDIKLQASKKTLPIMLQKRHLFLLELERIINHLTDLSMLCQLVGFKDGANFFIVFVEDARNIMKKLTGHRFGFSSIKIDIESINIDEVYEFLFFLEKKLLEFQKWIETKDKILWDTLLLGEISRNQVIDYGLVGLMARSAGIRLDRREEDEFYLNHDFHINLEEVGDTFGRFNVRITEILSSLRIMRSLANQNLLPFFLGTMVDGEYYSYVESSAGEVMMYIALKDSKIERFFLRDPSFLNAQALPLFLKDTNVSKLDLVIKSIPLNISAIDL